MTGIVIAHRLLSGTLAGVAVVGWWAYASSSSVCATRHQEQLEALSGVIEDRDSLALYRQRLERKLALANVQLAAARNEIAALDLQSNVTKKGNLGALEPAAPRNVAQKEPSGPGPASSR
jgi:hypothetical protein